VAQKKNLTTEYYDLTDPFIDDSELAMDERTYFAQTKQQGFYVSSGEVALLKDKSVSPSPSSVSSPRSSPSLLSQIHAQETQIPPSDPSPARAHRRPE